MRRSLFWLLASLALVIAVVILLVVAPWQSSSPPKLTAPAPQCQPNPQAAIDALPVGGTFNANGCYDADGGIHVTVPGVTIAGPDGGMAAFQDTSSTQPGNHTGGLQPVIKIIDTTGVTLKNLDLVGGNVGGGYNPKLVTGAGIAILSSTNIQVLNVNTVSTFGDGVEMAGNYSLNHPTPVVQDSNITIDTLTVTRAGRHCFDPIEVFDSAFSNIDCVSSADTSVDMESDIPAIGSGNLAFANVTFPHGVYIQEPITGPLTFDAATLGARFSITTGTATVDGSIICQRAAWPACIRARRDGEPQLLGPGPLRRRDGQDHRAALQRGARRPAGAQRGQRVAVIRCRCVWSPTEPTVRFTPLGPDGGIAGPSLPASPDLRCPNDAVTEEGLCAWCSRGCLESDARRDPHAIISPSGELMGIGGGVDQAHDGVWDERGVPVKRPPACWYPESDRWLLEGNPRPSATPR